MEQHDLIANDKPTLIFLVGFMGSGKTYWGRRWTRHNPAYSFIDLDEAIESAEQQSVAAIFESKGEEYFRRVEAATVRALPLNQKLVVACGGGTPCFFYNMEWMLATGTTVWLRATHDRILENIAMQPGSRPLLQPMNDQEMLAFIKSKLGEREQYYSRAAVIVDADDITDNFFDSIVLKK